MLVTKREIKFRAGPGALLCPPKDTIQFRGRSRPAVRSFDVAPSTRVPLPDPLRRDRGVHVEPSRSIIRFIGVVT